MHVILRPLVVAAALIGGSPLMAAAQRPNIVLFLMDDMGYGDVRAYNAGSKIATPSLDRLAAEGMRFTDAHSPSGVCTPTRYALMTGRYSWRSRLKQGVLQGYSPALIEPGRLTLPLLLRRAGYATAGVGKWHLGLGDAQRTDYTQPLRPGPLTQGFDSFFGIPASLDMEPYVYITNEGVEAPPTASDPGSGKCCTGPFWRPGAAAPGFKPVDVLPRITEHAVRYIDGRAKSQQPFFLYVAYASPHTPWVPSDEYRGRSGAGEYGDFMEQTDASIGRILDALHRHKLADSTLVIATSDNGAYWRPEEIAQYGHRSNHTWRGMKSDIFEAGHRVPLIARYPGRIVRGAASDALITLVDIMATAASIVGVRLPADAAEDSFDFSPVLLGKTDARPLRDAAVHHSGSGMFAIRQGPWKLVDGLGSGGFTAPRALKPAPGEPRGQLYNLAEDPGETTNVYARHPEVVKRLRALLGHYQQAGRSRPALSAVAAARAQQLLETTRPLVIAHRGYSLFAPENTLPAFELAKTAGADLVELDYHHTRDGVPIVIHDAELDRTTNAVKKWGSRGTRIESRTAEELRTLDAGSWFDPKYGGARLPLLTEAVDAIQRGGGVTLIERKAGDAATCARMLRERNLINQVVVQAFDWEFLRELHAQLPEQILGALGPPGGSAGRKLSDAEKALGPAWIDAAARTGARIVVWNRQITREAVDQAHARGLKVWVYTIDDPAQAIELLDLGVDGIITNNTSIIWRAVALGARRSTRREMVNGKW